MTTASFQFFSYQWATSITPDGDTEIRIYGLMEDSNKTTCVIVRNFKPYAYIEFPEYPENSTVEWNSINVGYVAQSLEWYLKNFWRTRLEEKQSCGENEPISNKDFEPIISVEYLHKLYYAHYDVQKKEKKKYPFLKVQCDNVEQIKMLTSICRGGKENKGIKINSLGKYVKLKVQEANATPVLQFTSTYNIPTAGWIKCLSARQVTYASEAVTFCQPHEYVCSRNNLFPAPEVTKVARPLILSFDLEVYSNDPTKMPVATQEDNQIFQISCVFHRFGEPMENCKKHLLTMGDPIQSEVGDDVKISRFRIGDPEIGCEKRIAEAALLQKFDELVREQNPNLITGFNIFGFDISYMKQRASLLGYSKFPTQGLRRPFAGRNEKGKYVKDLNPDSVREMSWSSSAFKNQMFEYIDAEGRLYLDLLPYIRRNYKFDNYRLKTITEALVGSTKDPLTPKGIFKCYDAGAFPTNFTALQENKHDKSLRPVYSEHGRKRMSVCGKYCVQDSYLVLELMNKVHAWVDLTELAKICNVGISDLYIKGQQIRVFSQIYKKCRGNHVVQQNECIPSPDDHYQGAIVFDPVPGMYDNVIPFDFSSLYPTSIIAENIDFSTIVYDDAVPDSVCNVIEWEEHYGCVHDKNNAKRKSKAKYILCSQQRYRYLKEPKGILPALLENLIAARKQTKKEIEDVEERLKSCTSDAERKNMELYLAVLDKRQLAFKVCANSGYGAMGVQKGYLPFMPGAKCTTAVGRRSIERVAKFIPERFGGQLIYGDTDSNYIHFPQFNQKSAAEIWDYAVFVADETSKLFKKPMKLEFECKIYTRFLILTKKRYMCLSCKRDGIVSPKIDKKGVLLARRDNSKAVRDIYSNIIMRLFHREDRDDIVYSTLQMINRMCSGVLPPKDFVITKAVGDVKKRPLTDDERAEYFSMNRPDITETFLLENIEIKFRKLKTGTREYAKATIGNYKVDKLSDDDPAERQSQLAKKNVQTEHDYYLKSLPAQVQLAEKMRKRGQIVAVGSRMEFLVSTDGSIYNINSERLYEKLEDIVYFMAHKASLKIDYLYYLKALAKPLDEVFSIIYSADKALADTTLKKDLVMKQFKIRLQFIQVMHELKSLFAPRVVLVDEHGSILFDPQETKGKAGTLLKPKAKKKTSATCSTEQSAEKKQKTTTRKKKSDTQPTSSDEPLAKKQKTTTTTPPKKKARAVKLSPHQATLVEYLLSSEAKKNARPAF